MSVASQIRAVVGGIPRALARLSARRYFATVGDCRETQQATLRRLLDLNAESRFSRSHGLDEVRTVDDFRDRLPVVSFDAFRPWVDEVKQGRHDALLGRRNRLLMFSISSGTTAGSKFIPITEPFLRDYRRGWQIWGIHTLDAHPGCNSRQILQISSDYDRFRTAGGTPCGSISGLVSAMQKRIVRSMYCIPSVVAKIDDPFARYYTVLRLALADPAVGMVMTANPSTLIHLARLAEQHRESLTRDIAEGTLTAEIPVAGAVRDALRRRISHQSPGRARELAGLSRFLPRDYWRELEVVAVWTGGTSGAFLPTVRELYGDLPIRDHGLSASEGRMTIPLEPGTSSGVLDLHSHFFEFIPEREYGSVSPIVLQAHELQEGERYYILLTTSSGLSRYDICDVVRCTGFRGPFPMVEFLHKGAHIGNLTGEKITEFQVVEAVRAASARAGVPLSQFTVCPVWGDPPGYLLLLEEGSRRVPRMPQDVAERLATGVEAAIQESNCEYREKRETSRLAPLSVRRLPPGSFLRLQRERLMRSGGTEEQYKHPCLIPQLEFWPAFSAAIEIDDASAPDDAVAGAAGAIDGRPASLTSAFPAADVRRSA